MQEHRLKTKYSSFIVPNKIPRIWHRPLRTVSYVTKSHLRYAFTLVTPYMLILTQFSLSQVVVSRNTIALGR
jgi:hypothetical protein